MAKNSTTHKQSTHLSFPNFVVGRQIRIQIYKQVNRLHGKEQSILHWAPLSTKQEISQVNRQTHIGRQFHS